MYIYLGVTFPSILLLLWIQLDVGRGSTNAYGNAQVACYNTLTQYAIAERTRKDICQAFYSMRDCMGPKISHDVTLIKIFEKDLVPYVTRYHCDGKRKKYEQTTPSTSGNNNGSGATGSKGGNNGSKGGNGGVRGKSFDNAVTALIIIAVIMAVVMAAVIVFIEMRSRRNCAATTNARKTSKPRDRVTSSKNVYKDNINVISHTYENVSLKTKTAPVVPNRNSNSAILKQIRQYENLEAEAPPKPPNKKLTYNFKKLSESDSEHSPSHLTKDFRFNITTSDTPASQSTSGNLLGLPKPTFSASPSIGRVGKSPMLPKKKI